MGLTVVRGFRFWVFGFQAAALVLSALAFLGARIFAQALNTLIPKLQAVRQPHPNLLRTLSPKAKDLQKEDRYGPEAPDLPQESS